MKQPQLGETVKILRQQKGLTQEELAFKCDLDVRSIQRIENGAVFPQLSTLKNLSTYLDHDFLKKSQSQIEKSHQEKFWICLMHLSNIIPLVFFPVLVMVFKKDDFPQIEAHARKIINFQISMCILLFAASAMMIFIIGLLVLPLIGIFIFFISIINTIKTATDQEYRYPTLIQLV